MKKTIVLLSMLAIIFSLQAQDEKLRIAVFDPTSSGTAIDEGTKVAVREIVSSTFVNTGKYTIVERSLLDKVMKEQQFSNTDIVDESQATELGRLAGANKVVLSVVTLVGGRNMLSIKMIDVKTATIDQQKTKIVGSNDLLDVIEPLTLELMGEKANYNTTTQSITVSSSINNHSTQTTNQVPTPKEGEISFYFAGYEPKNPDHGDNIIIIYLDKEQIGSGTIREGFSITVKDNNPGKHKLTFGAKRAGEITSYKIDTSKKTSYEFRCNAWKYLGVPFYSIIMK
ncbi:MAG: CsgG/HfaB family protein [Dysgonamonadaceae bacterium]|jgi:hypothetical protein|nr:CsgG/HfaB family protein [Dysgonamonadaceae bacterium]